MCWTPSHRPGLFLAWWLWTHRRRFIRSVHVHGENGLAASVYDARCKRSLRGAKAMRRVLVAAGVALALLLAGASVARADHTHVLILPNAKCAILAAEGSEKYLILPAVLFSNNPHRDADHPAGSPGDLPLNRRHPLHVLVHLGVPGADGDIAVMGSAQDPCAATGDYVNG